MGGLVYLDLETTGLDPARHEVWEAAWAWGLNEIESGILAHSGHTADPDALRVNGYLDREGWVYDGHDAAIREVALFDSLKGSTVIGANPAFDASFLRARWSEAPWKYRLFDIEAFAMPAAGWDRPQGLKSIADFLRNADWEIPEPDHTAAGDVATLRACHLALVEIYAQDALSPSPAPPTPPADGSPTEPHDVASGSQSARAGSAGEAS